MALAAYNPTDRVEQLILLTERLSGIMDEENAVLADRRPRELEQYAKEKSRLAAIYAQEIRAIARDKSLVAGAPPELTERLKTFTKKFESRAEAQKALLSRARRVTEGAIKAIGDEIAARQPKPSAYGVRGPAGAPAMARPQAVALNQVV
ncbi:MAG: flagellar basal body protein [Pseudomonadota bacterium]